MNILISGINGQMGKLIKKSVKRKYPHVFINEFLKGDKISDKIKNNDLVIDFSAYSISKEVITCAIDNKISIISGTTGFSKEEINYFKEKANENNVCFYWTPNFSIGYNVLLEESENLHKLFPEMIIKETHSINKKDKPSGTARQIADLCLYDIDKIKSYRIKQNIAKHEIRFYNQNESFTIKHIVKGKKAYVNGFLKKIDEIFGRELNA